MIKTIETLGRCSVATVTSTLVKLGFDTRFFRGLRPASAGNSRFVGEAFTIRTIPVREDLRAQIGKGIIANPHRRALADAQAGAVIVFSADGNDSVSLLGDIIALDLKQRGVSGVVMDCGAGDIPGIAAVGLPVFCLGSAPVPGSTRIQVADWNVPIGCAGVAVYPGDIIVGDETGAACIPRDLAAEVAETATEQERLEEFLVAQIKAGEKLETTYPPDDRMKALYRQWRAPVDR